MSAGRPHTWVTMTALVRGVALRRISAGSMYWASLAVSQNTGTAPAWQMAQMPLIHVLLAVSTSSPGPTPIANSPEAIAAVPALKL